jgi:hypothetical protein
MTRLTQDEQRTMVTLWSIARSPLILGANLTKLDPWTTSLITNAEVIRMNQHGHDQKQVTQDGDLIAWTSKGAPGEHYLALFNLGDTDLVVDRPFAAYGLPKGILKAHDAWTGEPVEAGSGPVPKAFQRTLPPHGCVLLELKER